MRRKELLAKFGEQGIADMLAEHIRQRRIAACAMDIQRRARAQRQVAYLRLGH
jgi:hypothetical protein